MASDKKQFKVAYDKWLELAEARKFSVAPHFGRIAILVSHLVNYEANADSSINFTSNSKLAEILHFHGEALSIQEKAEKNNRQAYIFDDATSETFIEVLADDTITDVITIGHGSLSYLYVPSDTRVIGPKRFSEYTAAEYQQQSRGNRFDWYDVAKAATHLKLGSFVQRHCGHQVRELSVPLGMFAVSDPSKVIAAINCYFNPPSITHDDNLYLRSILEQPMNISYESMKITFPQWVDAEETVED